jgi:hypothetical protein
LTGEPTRRVAEEELGVAKDLAAEAEEVDETLLVLLVLVRLRADAVPAPPMLGRAVAERAGVTTLFLGLSLVVAVAVAAGFVACATD